MADLKSPSFPISLRPPSKEDYNTEALGDLIYRINVERKGFRNVTEAQLEREVDDADHGLTQDESSDSEAEVKEEEEKGTLKYLAIKRAELSNMLYQAQTETQIALDMASLLGTRYNTYAKSSMSPSLTASIPQSVLSYDKWDVSKADSTTQQDEAIFDTGSKMNELMASADALLKTAADLEETITRDTQYWAQVLSLKNNGWPVYKVPGDKRTTVVQFSSTEAGPLFKDRGIVALRANKNGTIKLGHKQRLQPAALRVRFLENGVVQRHSGILSSTSLPILDESLDEIVRRAHDSLFDQELYHEITIEARALQPMGVSVRTDGIHIPSSLSSGTGSGQEWLVDLVDLEELPTKELPANEQSSMTATLLRLLLTRLYRKRLQQRSELPPPLTVEKNTTALAFIVRPLMALSQHQSAYKPFLEYLSSLERTLRSAELPISLDATEMPALTIMLNVLKSPTVVTKKGSELDLLMDQICKPAHTTISLTLTIDQNTSIDNTIKITVITDISPPILGTEYVLELPHLLAKLMKQKRIVFKALENIKDYITKLIATDIVRNLLRPRHEGWRHTDMSLHELSKVVAIKGKSAEIAVGITIEDGCVEAYQTWVSEDRELHRETWKGEASQGNLLDIIGNWIREVSKADDL